MCIFVFALHFSPQDFHIIFFFRRSFVCPFFRTMKFRLRFFSPAPFPDCRFQITFGSAKGNIIYCPATYLFLTQLNQRFVLSAPAYLPEKYEAPASAEGTNKKGTHIPLPEVYLRGKYLDPCHVFLRFKYAFDVPKCHLGPPDSTHGPSISS